MAVEEESWWQAAKEQAVAGTEVVTAFCFGELAAVQPGRQTVVRVVQQDCVELCQQLWQACAGRQRIAVLNFASGSTPGGMFKAGATKAQEESLCARSALFDCLNSAQARPFYEANRRLRGAAKRLQSQAVIYSPAVPFAGDAAYRFDVISAPAVHAAGYALQRRAEGASAADIDADVEQAMLTRIANVLALAAARGVDHLVLGAFGCGVFGNSPDAVARHFAAALAEQSARDPGRFVAVHFALLDHRSEVVGPFLALAS